MQKKGKILSWIFVVILCISNPMTANEAKAETVGKGARIILYEDSGKARFHLGGAVGESVKLTAEPTGKKELTDIVFTSSDSSVCRVTKEEAYCLVERIKEGTAVITMRCKADGELVVRTLLMSNLVEQGSADNPVYGIAKEGTTVYYGCSDKEGITSKDTEVKCVLSEDTPVYVTYCCGDFYRIELDNSFFGDSDEYWGYVKKSQVVIPVSEISLEEELTYYEGENGSLQATVLPENATEKRMKYQSSNTNVVTVDEKGNFKAIGVGSAVITVTSLEDEDIYAKCRMTVKPFIPVTGIMITPGELDIEDGQIGDLSVKVLPKNASRPDYTIFSEDDSVIKVHHDGHYEAKKPGKTSITAITKEGSYKAECLVNVRSVPVKGIQIQSNMSVNIGDEATPTWFTTPRNASNRNVTWTSSNPKVATVDKRGRVTGVSLGTAVIQVCTVEGGYTASCQIKVEQYVDDLEITNKPKTLTLGAHKTLKVALMPENPTKQKLYWKTNNSSVIKVSPNGKITGVKTGSAKVTVYDRYTGAYDFCVVQVAANLKKPELKGKGKKKKYQLSWKKVNRATNYVIYQYKKKKKAFRKIKTVDNTVTSYVVKKPSKGDRYKIKAFYKPSKEYSKFSNAQKIK